MKKHPKDMRPPFMVVADDLRDAIAHGRYQPGDRIPSANELAQQYEVSPVTVQAAFKELKNEGLLEGRQGAGTFVTEASTATNLVDAIREALSRDESEFRYAGPFTTADRSELSSLLLTQRTPSSK